MLYPTVNTTYTPADGHTLQMSFTSNRKYPAYWQDNWKNSAPRYTINMPI
jgi:hypothetical protein